MKTIIVPTDFSDAANNAPKVAKSIAIKTKASIHLANFYSLPVADYSYPDISMPAEILEQIRKAAIEGVDKISAELREEGFTVESTIGMGMVADEIADRKRTKAGFNCNGYHRCQWNCKQTSWKQCGSCNAEYGVSYFTWFRNIVSVIRFLILSI